MIIILLGARNMGELLGWSSRGPLSRKKYAGMEKKEIKSRVISVIASVLKTEEAMVGEKDNFIFDLGADSMQSLQLVAGFEEEFDIEMDEDKALEVQTVGDAVDFIAQYL